MDFAAHFGVARRPTPQRDPDWTIARPTPPPWAIAACGLVAWLGRLAS